DAEARRRDPRAADAVGDRVMHAGEQRGAVTIEPLGERQLPQRAGGVEGVLVAAGSVVEQMTVGAGMRKRDVADVVVEVEVRIVGPRTAGDALAQPPGAGR